MFVNQFFLWPSWRQPPSKTVRLFLDCFILMMRKMMILLMMIMKMMFPTMSLLLMLWFPLMILSTRGDLLTSSHGVEIVIEVLTGLLLDYEVFSKNCHGCASTKAKNMTDDERKEWEEHHKSKYVVNLDGFSKAMEEESALILWSRSLEKYKIWYTCMLSDGDSTAHSAVMQRFMVTPQ